MRDETTANYDIRGAQGTFNRWLLTNIAKHAAPTAIRGEFTTRFNYVAPKTLSFDMILRADTSSTTTQAGFDTKLMKQKVSELQSLCYPRAVKGLNPPLCRLIILGLYSLECYVMQVSVTWHNQWELASGIPMGCDIAMQVLMHQYPIREEVQRGAGFDTSLIGYGGSPADAGLTGFAALKSAVASGLGGAVRVGNAAVQTILSGQRQS